MLKPLITAASCVHALALLYPSDLSPRDRRSLDGLWTFVREPKNTQPSIGVTEQWYTLDLATTFEVNAYANDYIHMSMYRMQRACPCPRLIMTLVHVEATSDFI